MRPSPPWPSLAHAAEANRRDLGTRRAVSSTHPPYSPCLHSKAPLRINKEAGPECFGAGHQSPFGLENGGNRQAAAAAAVIEIQHSTHPIGTGLERVGARLPACRADLIAVLGDELACTHEAQQFGGIAADAAGVHLVRLDAALGVDDESAALGLAGAIDQNLEIARKRLRRVGEHRVVDLADGLGFLVPRHVDELGVAGDGIHFATGGFELVV